MDLKLIASARACQAGVEKYEPWFAFDRNHAFPQRVGAQVSLVSGRT
jgi:hypothetical protein